MTQSYQGVASANFFRQPSVQLQLHEAQPAKSKQQVEPLYQTVPFFTCMHAKSSHHGILKYQNLWF